MLCEETNKIGRLSVLPAFPSLPVAVIFFSFFFSLRFNKSFLRAAPACGACLGRLYHHCTRLGQGFAVV